MSSADHSARVLWQSYETVNAVTYFSPEPRQAATDVGLRGFWMGYFAFRAAPMGAVEPGVIEATFFNFHPTMVRRAVPDAWTYASPADVLVARSRSAAEALRRSSPAVDDVARTINSLLARVALDADGAGRPLFAANRALVEAGGSDDEVEALWQLCTTVREHRGDGHVAALTAAGLDGCAVHVLFAASEGVAPEVLQDSRGWTTDDWAAAEDHLRVVGLVDADGITPRGRELRDQIERTTDELSWRAFSVLGADELAVLGQGLDQVAGDVLAGEEIRFPNPMGLTRR